MKAVVLAAGLGKRMGPLTKEKPKALVRLNGKPLLQQVLESLEKAGVKQVLVVVGFKGGLVRKRFGKQFGKIKLGYVTQRIPMGTAHAVLKARGKVKGRFLVGSCDVVLEPGLWKRLWAKKGFDTVVALRPEKNPEKFGVALVKGKKLVQLVEKPEKKLASNLVNAGAYSFSQKIFPALVATKISSRGEFEITDSVNILAGKGKAGFLVYRGKCLDIGSRGDLKKAKEKVKKVQGVD
jgi:dTDP-glucose pyrophosphorylase